MDQLNQAVISEFRAKSRQSQRPDGKHAHPVVDDDGR
jgi:hypothetical protein